MKLQPWVYLMVKCGHATPLPLNPRHAACAADITAKCLFLRQYPLENLFSAQGILP
jgi:hypothetical protein